MNFIQPHADKLNYTFKARLEFKSKVDAFMCNSFVAQSLEQHS